MPSDAERRPSEPALASGSSEPEPAAADATPAADPEAAAAVLEKIESLIIAGQETEKDTQFCIDAKLAPARESRLRRKSKDLQDQCLSLMGAQLEQTFKDFDKDGSGTIDAAELKAAFEKAGRPVTDEAIARSIKAMDKNNDGVVRAPQCRPRPARPRTPTHARCPVCVARPAAARSRTPPTAPHGSPPLTAPRPSPRRSTSKSSRRSCGTRRPRREGADA